MSNVAKTYNIPVRDESGIIEVYEDNFISEIKKIGSLLSEIGRASCRERV